MREIFIWACLSIGMPIEYAHQIYTESGHDIDPVRVAAIIHTESAYNPRALNRRTGTMGLGQISRFWVRELNIPRRQLFNPHINLHISIGIYRHMKNNFSNTCERIYGRYFCRRTTELAMYRCGLRSFRTPECRRSVNTVLRMERFIQNRINRIYEEIQEREWADAYSCGTFRQDQKNNAPICSIPFH